MSVNVFIFLFCLFLLPLLKLHTCAAFKERFETYGEFNNTEICSEEKACRTNFVRILLHQLPYFAGAAVGCLNDKAAGVVLLCGLRQQLLQHGDDRT